jgi:transcriptional regulator with PAS, ATPase and Fis domain
MDEPQQPVIVEREPYGPRALGRYAKRVNMPMEKALIHVLKTSRTYDIAAKKLGISRQTLRRWIKRYNIIVVEGDPDV